MTNVTNEGGYGFAENRCLSNKKSLVTPEIGPCVVVITLSSEIWAIEDFDQQTSTLSRISTKSKFMDYEGVDTEAWLWKNNPQVFRLPGEAVVHKHNDAAIVICATCTGICGL